MTAERGLGPGSGVVPPRLSMVVLGARDLPVLRRFYVGLGWPERPGASDALAMFELGTTVLALHPASAEDSCHRMGAQPAAIDDPRHPCRNPGGGGRRRRCRRCCRGPSECRHRPISRGAAVQRSWPIPRAIDGKSFGSPRRLWGILTAPVLGPSDHCPQTGCQTAHQTAQLTTRVALRSNHGAVDPGFAAADNPSVGRCRIPIALRSPDRMAQSVPPDK